MNPWLRRLDGTISAALAFVLVFPPLAFGAVEDWARALAQLAVFVAFGAWVLRTVWAPPPVPPGTRTWFGGRVVRSGLEGPALLLAAVVALQLVPLPPTVVGTVSPRTAELFRASLPGWGEEAKPSFAGLPGWLEADPQPEAGGVPALAPAPDALSAAFPAEIFDVPHAAWRPLSLAPAHTSRALVLLLSHCALFVVAFHHLRERRRAVRFLWLVAGVAGALSVVGVLQSLTSDGKLYGWRTAGPNQSFGPFVNANNFAGWMEMAVPVAAGLAAMGWERLRRGSGGSTRGGERAGRSQAATLLVGAVATLGLAAFLMSRSRGGLLSAAAALATALVVTLARGRLRWRGTAAALVLVAAALGFAAWIDAPGLTERYGTMADLEDDRSFRARWIAYEHVARMVADFPLLGTGLGTFREAYYLYTPGTFSTELRRAHNDWLQLLAECGAFGGVAVAWGLAVLLGAVGAGFARGGGSFRWPVRGAALGVLALAFHSLVDFNLQIYSNGMLFAFLAGLLLRDRCERASRNEPAVVLPVRADAAPPAVGWAVTALVLAGVATAAWAESVRARAWFVRRTADRAFERGDIEAALDGYREVARLLPSVPRAHTDLADSISQRIESAEPGAFGGDAVERAVAEGVGHYLRAIGSSPPGAWSYAGLGALAEAAAPRRDSTDLAALFPDPEELDPRVRFSEAAWARAVALEPRNFYYRDLLADFYLRHGFRERGLAHVRAAVRLHPRIERHYYLPLFAEVSPAVLAAVEQGMRDALQDERRGVSEFDIHRHLADVYLRMGRVEDAKASLAAAAKVAERPYTVDIQLGLVLAREGDDDGALEAFRRAVEREPGSPRGWQHLALTLSRMGRHDEAAEAALRARGLAPADLAVLTATARVLEAAERLDDAAAVLETVLRTYPDRSYPYQQLIGVYERQGRIARAVRVARELVEHHPDEPAYREQLRQLESLREQGP